MIQLFGEDQGGIPPKRRSPKLRGLRKSALNTFWFFLLPSTTICFGEWWKRNGLKRLKIERLNWICNLSNSKKQEEEEDQKSCQRLKHLSSHCIYPPRKILTDSIFQRGFVSYAMAFICHIGSNFWIPGSKVTAVFPRGGMMINLISSSSDLAENLPKSFFDLKLRFWIFVTFLFFIIWSN